MSRDSYSHTCTYSVIYGFAAGVFVWVPIVYILLSLGVGRVEAFTFAFLSGFTVAGFVYRERSLTESLNGAVHEKRSSVARLEARIDSLYDDSLACLAYFDAGALTLDRVSPGLLRVLRLAPDVKVRGKSIADLLRVDPSKLETIIGEVQGGAGPERQYELVAEDMRGDELKLLLTMSYLPDQHMIDAAFLPISVYGPDELAEMENARKNLDRFRRGMYRRETRILELKQEVNDVLVECGKERRYQTDRASKDTGFEIQNADSEDSREGASS